jgi:DNA replication and repair protein RecF
LDTAPVRETGLLVAVTWFEARNVRVVREIGFAPAAQINLLVGENGSGKTSILEALYMLGSGRSFINAQLENVIRRGATALRVVARIEEAGRESVLGVERAIGTAPDIHFDGDKVDGFARLAERVPAQVIYPQSNELVIGGPTYRRRFVDWGVFHVEHDFMDCWREYQRALGQRNAALRNAGTAAELSPWDHVLERAGERLAQYRNDYVQQLAPYVDAFAGRLFATEGVELQIQRGWAADTALRDALARSFERDRRAATTSVGPHRAELRIRYAGHEARVSASRGQQKLLVYALKLAQIEHLWQVRQRRTMLLLDDLPSELDWPSRTRVFDTLREIAGQIFVTAIERQQLEPLLDDLALKVFHVEQGAVSELV